MSLPLTRRIARAALLVAAGAAPVVGAAGSASAAELPKATDLGGLTAVDPGSVSETAADGLQQTGAIGGAVGGEAVKQALPAAGEAGAETLRQTTPTAQEAAGDLTGQAGEVVGHTTETLPLADQLPAEDQLGQLPAADLLQGGLPTEGLPTEALPLEGLPTKAVGQLPTGSLPVGLSLDGLPIG